MIDPHHQYDPLLECLVIFTKLHNRPISVEALIAGLPVEPGADGPELFSIDNPKGLFSRVASRAGFASRLIHRNLASLSRLLLPCKASGTVKRPAAEANEHHVSSSFGYCSGTY